MQNQTYSRILLHWWVCLAFVLLACLHCKWAVLVLMLCGLWLRQTGVERLCSVLGVSCSPQCVRVQRDVRTDETGNRNAIGRVERQSRLFWHTLNLFSSGLLLMVDRTVAEPQSGSLKISHTKTDLPRFLILPLFHTHTFLLAPSQK